MQLPNRLVNNIPEDYAKKIIAQKADSAARARSLSIQERATADATDTLGMAGFNWMVHAGELVSPWWSPSRDKDLRDFWKKSNHLAGALASFIARISTMRFRVLPVDKAVKLQISMASDFEESLLNNVEFGAGWNVFVEKCTTDLIAADNGFFAEIIGPGDPTGPILGRAVSLAHLDSSRCQRTSSPEYPVVYRDTDGKRYKLHYTRVMYASQMPSSNADMRGVGFCLHGDSTVLMANGKYERISNVVKRMNAKDGVISVDGNGNIVTKKIVGWHRSKRGARGMINIRGELARLVQGRNERNSWVTEDHTVLTPSGWVAAGDLKDGDSIVTELPTPNKKQLQFLVGTLLGDGCMSMPRNVRPKLSFGHCKAQTEWFKIKGNVVKDDFYFTSKEYDFRLTYKGKEKVYPGIKGHTHSHAGFLSLNRAFYPSGKKVAPLDLIRENVSPLMWVTWYLDDGSIADRRENSRNRKPHARIATAGFTMDEVQRLCDILSDAGYCASPVSARGEVDKRDIRMSVEGSRRFYHDIAPYVPKSMRYKIPRDSAPYDSSLWDLGRADRLIDRAIVERKNDKPAPRFVYCIDVEDTHNFVSAGMVVHNCAVSRCIDIAQNLQDIARYKQEKLGSRPPRVMILGKKGITANDIFSAFYAAEEMMDSQNLGRYSKNVVVAPKRGFGEIDLEILDLASFPDGFDEEQSTTLGMFAIALALGVDARELWPATVSGATKADAMIQHLKARGKGIGQTLQTFQRQINQKFLPRTLWFEFDQQDDEQDMVQAEVRDMRSIRHERDLTSGTVDVRTAREQMLDKGDLTPAQFERMELEDGRLPDGASILTLFYSEDEEIKQYLSGIGDPKTMLERDIDSALNTAISGALEAIAHLPRDTQRGKARQALAALEFVKEERKVAEEEEARIEAESAVDDVDGRTTQPVNRPEYRPESTTEVVRRMTDE